MRDGAGFSCSIFLPGQVPKYQPSYKLRTEKLDFLLYFCNEALVVAEIAGINR